MGIVMMVDPLAPAISAPLMRTRLKMTVEAFDEWAALPENINQNYEYIAGEVVEKMVSNAYPSLIAIRFAIVVGAFVEERELGYMTGADGGYWVNGERYIPDVAFVSRERQPKPCRETYNPNAPDLAIEVKSPTDNDDEIAIKIVNYLQAGTTVWLSNPDYKQTTIFIPGQKPVTLAVTDTLDGGSVLPDFSVPLKRIYKE
ncbi:MAG: Uma2 family endonuclease [Chloroflexota bacterium]|nr:Uma2 family endonuclease [Chloroflexota bacterium]